MTYFYNRSEVVSYYDLTEKQQSDNVDYLGLELASETMYVICDHNNEALPLCMFMRTTNNNFTHGVYTQTNSSAYCITFNRSNDEAVVAYRG